MPRSVFITATDTGVGKTIVTAGIARAFKAEGFDVGVMKPLATGDTPSSEDAKFLARAISSEDPLKLINPFYLRAPLSPYTASMIKGKKVKLKRILKSYKILLKLHQVLVVEGIGGLLVPISEKYFVKDLILEFNLPIIIVASPFLGTLNHTLMTIQLARENAIPIEGVVLNYYKRVSPGVAERTNPQIIQKISRVKILAEIPFLNKITPENLPLFPFMDVIKFLEGGRR